MSFTEEKNKTFVGMTAQLKKETVVISHPYSMWFCATLQFWIQFNPWYKHLSLLWTSLSRPAPPFYLSYWTVVFPWICQFLRPLLSAKRKEFCGNWIGKASTTSSRCGFFGCAQCLDAVKIHPVRMLQLDAERPCQAFSRRCYNASETFMKMKIIEKEVEDGDIWKYLYIFVIVVWFRSLWLGTDRNCKTLNRRGFAFFLFARFLYFPVSMSTNWWPLPMPWRWHKLLWHAVTMLWLKIWIITSSNPYHFPAVHIQKKWKHECCSSLCHFWLGKDVFLEMLLRPRRCFISFIVERNKLLYLVFVNKLLKGTNYSTCKLRGCS